ncbi:MAG TPA: carbohydrate binding family 9 domain-containing protein [Vicinamibacterales bacterium]|nr:carbohydrate binding family 9 domain-containing protein [Vicinamibacterales bacterium]
MRRLPRASTALVGLVLVSSGAAAQPAADRTTPPPLRTYTVQRAVSPIRIDGHLDEPAWRSATVVPLQYEWFPGDNVEPRVRTDCLVTFDAERLYVAFRAYDPEPSAIRARLVDRDTAFQDDTVGFMVDPFNDGRRAFQFRVNALGVQMDAVNSDIDTSEDWSWDAIWESRGRIVDDGYIVEIAVPFSSLRFARRPVQTWGFVALRDYPRSTRHRMQSAWRDRRRTCLICQFDKLSGLEGISPGRNVELDPTVTAARTDRRTVFPGGTLAAGPLDPQAGLTARWGITPGTMAHVTLNPDFYQVEADVAQLEINNRFALFYPEKRPFFLEGADFFATPVRAVFTRTVTDPSWGAKLTGKQGRHAYGLFLARDEIANFILPSNQGSRVDALETELTSGVYRYRRDIGGGSSLGLLYTGREGSGYHNRVGGVDGLLRPTRSSEIKFQYLRSDTQYPAALAERQGERLDAFGGNAWLLEYFQGTRDYALLARYRDLSPTFRADSGFEPRVDTRTLAVAGERAWWGRPKQWYTRLTAGGAGDRTVDYTGRVTDARLSVHGSYLGPAQTLVIYNPSWNREFFAGVTYDNLRHTIVLQSRPSGTLALAATIQAGETIDVANARPATTLSVAPSIEFSAARRINGTASHTFQRLTVRGGRLFTANLAQTRLIYHFNVRTFVRAILQYTAIDREVARYLTPVPPRTRRLFSQYLFSYKLNPQTVLLLGYSDTYQGLVQVDLTQTDRTFFLKLGYAWVF